MNFIVTVGEFENIHNFFKHKKIKIEYHIDRSNNLITLLSDNIFLQYNLREFYFKLVFIETFFYSYIVDELMYSYYPELDLIKDTNCYQILTMSIKDVINNIKDIIENKRMIRLYCKLISKEINEHPSEYLVNISKNIKFSYLKNPYDN